MVEANSPHQSLPPSDSLQRMLQSAVQSVQWTYSLFWKICTQQGMLVWGDGYYNGGIKTRKTMQSMEVSDEEASLHRSQQLRDLYESLSGAAGHRDTTKQQILRWPLAALSPEDLTEMEWFYLMCISFSFPPGLGLPGKAYASKQHVWITGANEIDCKTFSRAILAKSARIKTVVCIPLMGGVVELGTTDKVKEDVCFIQHIKSMFFESQSRPPKPALSELSTSNSATSNFHLHSSPIPTIYGAFEQLAASQQQDHYNYNDSAAESDFITETSKTNGGHCPLGWGVAVAAEPSELMQIELSEHIRLGSPDDASNNLDTDFHFLNMPHSANSKHALLAEYYKNGLNLQPQAQGTSLAAASTEDELEDIYYSHTVSTILQNQKQSSLWSDSSSVSSFSFSIQSAFSKWTTGLHRVPIEGTSSSQLLLKYILRNVPLLHTKDRYSNLCNSQNGRWQKGAPHDELNEKFIILRSIVPFVNKMDKASILGDTIEYMKQLHRKIQDMEFRRLKLENHRRSSFKELRRIAATHRPRYDQLVSDKRNLHIMEEGVGDGGKHKVLKLPPHLPSPTSAEANLQVSIIETNGLLEIQSPYKEGLLLNIMQVLQNLQIETTAVQSSSSNGILVAKLRAQVKENVNGKKASITEIRRAIQQILPTLTFEWEWGLIETTL